MKAWEIGIQRTMEWVKANGEAGGPLEAIVKHVAVNIRCAENEARAEELREEIRESSGRVAALRREIEARAG